MILRSLWMLRWRWLALACGRRQALNSGRVRAVQKKKSSAMGANDDHEVGGGRVVDFDERLAIADVVRLRQIFAVCGG